MPVTDSNDGSDADRDEELAQVLQEQFRNEVESFASPSTWSQLQSVFSANNSSDSSEAGDASAAAPATEEGANARPMTTTTSAATVSSSAAVIPAKDDGGDYCTPEKFKKTHSDCTPDTVATVDCGAASPDRCADGFPLPKDVSVSVGRLTLLEHERQKQEQRQERQEQKQQCMGRLTYLELERRKQEQKQRQKQQHSKRNQGSTPRNSPKSSRRGSTRSSPRSSPSRESPRRSLISSLEMFAGTSNDEAVARRLERELRDAELASRLSRDERPSSRLVTVPAGSILPVNKDSFVESPARVGSGRSVQQGSEDCRGKIIHYGARVLLSLLISGITFVIYVTVLGRRTSDALDPASWLPGYPESDPSLGSVGEHNVWKPNNGDGLKRVGLKLTVLNNLAAGSDWNEHLESSINEWDSGTPDAITLNIRKMPHDPDCRAVRRAMKVCNADYGPTDWRGVNQILLQDDYIITSLAKMNDYYLEGTNKAQKQYTMCHELGHGLGLGHSDENFHNKDLGNCMDYTERPQNNMHPDTSNFVTLAELYGKVNVNGSNLKVERLWNGGDGRRVSDKQDSSSDDEFEKYAAYLLDPIVVSSEKQTYLEEEWRLLRKTDTAEFHERQLGNGFSIHTSILLAPKIAF